MIVNTSGILSNEHRQLLLNDFKKEIERVDHLVFGGRGLVSAQVFHMSEVDQGWTELVRILDFVSLFSTRLSGVIPFHKETASETPIAGAQVIDRYVILTTPVSAWLDKVFVNGFDHTGEADFALKGCWMLLAYAIVRTRVLRHTEWFPEARLRTKETIIRHRALFADKAGGEISGVRRLHEIALKATQTFHHPILIDVQLTTALIAQAAACGVSEDSVLSLLYSDNY
jgi:hypothetical protein